MASFIPKQSNKLDESDTYLNTKFSINECLIQLNDFTNAFNVVCSQANMLGRSLQKLEDLSMPEIIGESKLKRNPSRKFKNSALLMDSLDTFAKVMAMFTERIKKDAIDSFDNFIIQAVLPEDDQIKGIVEHNSRIIDEFRESFFSIQNHYLILSLELMESFLMCSDCFAPIGFPHQPCCLTGSMSKPNIWKKTCYDDKFITFGMNFCFNDLVRPWNRVNIIENIASVCLKQTQNQDRHSNTSLSTASGERWTRSFERRRIFDRAMRDKKFEHKSRSRHSPMRTLFKPSIWTPKHSDWLPIHNFTVFNDDN